MIKKSWYLPRRTLLKGGGVALALPLLNAMNGSLGNWCSGPWKANGTELPKRMLVSYFAYGAYMPDGPSGVPIPSNPSQERAHHPWSWWPCADAGPLTFNQSSKPFEPFKDDISYLRGLDHAGGWKLGGHSSGDVFATGADRVTEAVNVLIECQ